MGPIINTCVSIQYKTEMLTAHHRSKQHIQQNVNEKIFASHSDGAQFSLQKLPTSKLNSQDTKEPAIDSHPAFLAFPGLARIAIQTSKVGA